MAGVTNLIKYADTIADVVTLWPGSLVNISTRVGITPRFEEYRNDQIPLWCLKLSKRIERLESKQSESVNRVSLDEGEIIYTDERETLLKREWVKIQELNGSIFKDILKNIDNSEIRQCELSRRLGYKKLFTDNNLKEEDDWVVASFIEFGKMQGILKSRKEERKKFVSAGSKLEYTPIPYQLVWNIKKVHSWSESRTANILHYDCVAFISQMKFRDLKGNKRLLSFDFYLPEYGILIECQGIQHYQPVEFFGGQEAFELQKLYDQRKREYARDNEFILFEIPYYEDEYDFYMKNIKPLIS